MNNQRGILFKACTALFAASALLVPARSMAADVDTDGISDESDAVPCDPRATTVAFAPAKNVQGTLVFEDLWPAKGDLDFNDVAVTYNYIFFLDGAGRVSSMQASVNLQAAGGTIPNSLRLHLPVSADAASIIKLNFSDGVVHQLSPEPGEHELVIPLIADVNAAMGDAIANTTSTKPAVAGVPLNLFVKFATPIAIDLSQAPFDLFIERTKEPGHQIHQVSYPGTDTMDLSLFGTADDGSTQNRHFIDTDQLPFALSVPGSFQWPLEGVSISTAYPDITPWAASGGATHADWYQTNVQTDSVWTGGAGGTPPPVPVLLGPTDPAEDVQCAPWRGTAQFGLGQYTYAYATASDPSGNVVAAGIASDSTTRGFVTKYDAHKNQLWSKQLSAVGYVEALGVATDAQGNIYASGIVAGSIVGEAQLTGSDPFVAKLDPAGNILWVTHVGQGGQNLYGWGVTVGPDGSIDTTGYFYGNGTNGYVAQLDSDGHVLWVSQPSELNALAPFGVATDPSGNIYIDGISENGQTETVVAKLDPTGNVIWKHVDNSQYSWAELNSLAVDSHGNAYAAGFRQGNQNCYNVCYSCGFGCTSCYTQCDYVTDAPLWKIDTNGHQQWVTSVGPNSEGLGAAVDSAGNAIYTGVAWASVGGQPFSGGDDYFVAKVNPNGNTLWVREVGANNSNVTEGFAVCTDPSDSIFVAGLTTGDLTGMGNPNSGYQAFISKYDASGNLQ